MKFAPRQRAALTGSHTDVNVIAVEVDLKMFSRLHATMKGKPCEMA